MSFATALLLVILVLLGIPVMVYVSVKLGTLGFLQGRYQFFVQQLESKKDGDKKK